MYSYIGPKVLSTFQKHKLYQNMWVSLHNYINDSELLSARLWRNPHWKKLFSGICLGSLALLVCSSSCPKNIQDTFQFCSCPSMAKRLIFVTCVVENGEKCSLLSIYTKWNKKHFREISDLSHYWFASVYFTCNQCEVELQHFIH